MACQPLLDGFGFVNPGIIHHDREVRDPWSWVAPVQCGQAIAKQPLVLAGAAAIKQYARRKLQSSGQLRVSYS